MEVRELRYFLAVAREENITRAAESLHIAQPSLSKQLMELEKKLGKKLLIRGKRKITLTEEGVLLRKRAEEILELVEKTQQEISSDTEDVIEIFIWVEVRRHRFLGQREASGTISECEVSFLQWRCHRRVGAIEPWNTGFCSYAAAH